jgi:hypothetical protein
MLQVLGILAVVAVVFTLFIRPASIIAVVLAVGVVGAAIVVSWHDVEQVRAQRAANASFQQENAAASAAVTVPPNTARSGS